MNMYAIGRFASFNLESIFMSRNITGSLAVSKALRSNQVKPKLVWECLEQLNTLDSRNTIWILWVLGNIGLEDNEVADDLTKKGAEILQLGIEHFCGIGNGH